MILDTVYYGELVRKQGLRFFIMTEKCLNYIQEKQYGDKLKNTVVILSSENVILTVYKNSEAIRNIRKKSRFMRKSH